ncbi:ABC transporter substrate-binding protein [Bradyrhizobium sp. Tv2a-2]|uniref:ABC transporter substrate-binding protein n=1 Tax=Bradyrhizobium sp. Tv2a-2 TaxID=113395 RepID=UPI000464DBF2|nr:ABC transporter substrate-binding protein [Bradyrhizobium sp. Tv2a-2]
MNQSMNRRRFMQAASSVMTVGALSSGATQVSAASSGELRLNMSAGNFGEAVMSAFVKPFEAETGIKVTPVYQDLRVAQVALMVKTNSVTIDAILINQPNALSLAANSYVEKIDYSIHKQQELDGIVEYCKHPFGFGSQIYSMNIVYNTNKFPANKPRPTTWAEFWDVDKFPGTRALPSGQFGFPAPWEEALLADGVVKDALYTNDIDRVFASLDKIKPHVRKWWTSGAENLQILRDEVADIALSYDGRALALIDQGAPIEISRNQAKLMWDYWIVPKGAPNAQNAQKFIELVGRADRQAAFAQLFALSPSNRRAYELMPEKVTRKLATYLDYVASSYPVNGEWYAQTGSDGLSNSQRLIQRWNGWIVR